MTRPTPPARSIATRPPRQEHELLGHPRRDVVTAITLWAVTILLFVLMATPARHAIGNVDAAFLRRMLAIRSGPLTAIAKFMNVLGLVAVTLPVRLVIAGFLALKRRLWHLAAFASAVILSEISIGLLKVAYHRTRPPGSLVHVSGGSFPSGHAVAASVTTVAAVIALFPEGPRRYLWGVAAGIFSLVMALSRAYLAAHWLSDAVAGVLLGSSVALLCAVVVHFRHVRAGPERTPPVMVGPG